MPPSDDVTRTPWQLAAAVALYFNEHDDAYDLDADKGSLPADFFRTDEEIASVQRPDFVGLVELVVARAAFRVANRSASRKRSMEMYAFSAQCLELAARRKSFDRVDRAALRSLVPSVRWLASSCRASRPLVAQRVHRPRRRHRSGVARSRAPARDNDRPPSSPVAAGAA